MDAKLEQLEATLNNINVFNAGKNGKRPSRCWCSCCRRWNPFRWKHSGYGIPSPTSGGTQASRGRSMQICAYAAQKVQLDRR